MAAVSPASPVNDASAVRAFLQRAVALYRDVLALHGDDDRSIPEDGAPLPDDLLSAHTAQLGDAISMLKALQPVAAASDVPHPLSTVPGACYKVGQDLVLHLDRVVGRNHDRAAFCDAWPIRDVAALGMRLQELSRRFHDETDSSFE